MPRFGLVLAHKRRHFSYRAQFQASSMLNIGPLFGVVASPLRRQKDGSFRAFFLYTNVFASDLLSCDDSDYSEVDTVLNLHHFSLFTQKPNSILKLLGKHTA